jgi:hypothetical protein
VFSEGFGSNTRAEKALLFEYNGTDYTKSSILDFAESGTWTKAAFMKGKTDAVTQATLRTAASNLQRFCVIFYGPEFADSLKQLIDALENDPYLWEDFENLFVLWRVNLMLQQVGMILHSELYWKEDRDLATVAGCAGLLRGKTEECISQFYTKTGGVTEAPHRKFHEGSKIAETIVFRVPSPPKTPSPKKPPGTDVDNTEELLRDLDEDGEIREDGEEEKKERRKREKGGRQGNRGQRGKRGPHLLLKSYGDSAVEEQGGRDSKVRQ